MRIAKLAAAFIAVCALAGVATAGFDRFKQALDVGGQLNDLAMLQREFANAGKAAEDIGSVYCRRALSRHAFSNAMRRCLMTSVTSSH